ncbi:MAG: efflux transporter periplasmic adaptor subunit [Myxococcaceae bacterium]|nr:efflux transporter periplasmic adaptor subunit [Myxococcaceae bacterium]
MRRIACLLLLTAACHHEPKPNPTKPRVRGQVTLQGASLDYVRVDPAGAPGATAERPLLSRVTFDERRVAVLGTPVSGRVTSVEVVTGSTVKKGDALLTIHSADIAQARSEVAQAHEASLLAQQRAARARLLLQQGAGSEAEKQEMETALLTAKTEEQRASSALSALGGKGSASDYVMRAPSDGTVVQRTVDVGNAVGGDQGQPLITVADLGRVWVVAEVYEHDLPYVQAGQAAHVTVPSLSGRRYDAKIAYVGSTIDAVTRTASARVELDNPDGALHPGMFAEMVVDSPERASAVVPATALLARRDEMFLFVETTPGHFAQRKVKVGSQTGDHVALLDGVKAGERVVTRGAILLDAEANAAF